MKVRSENLTGVQQKSAPSAHFQSKLDQVNGPGLVDQPFTPGAANAQSEPLSVIALGAALRGLSASVTAQSGPG